MDETSKSKCFPFDQAYDNNIEYVASSPTTGTEESPEAINKYLQDSDSKPIFSKQETFNEAQESAINLISMDLDKVQSKQFQLPKNRESFGNDQLS